MEMVSNSSYAKLVRTTISEIISAKNRDDVLKKIMTEYRFLDGYKPEYKTRLFIIGRRLAGCMTDAQKKTMAGACMDEIRGKSMFFSGYGKTINAQIQAIYTLGVCASRSQLLELEKYHDSQAFKEAMLYTHGRTKTCVEWIYDALKADIRINKNKPCNHLAQTIFAMGLAMYNDGRKIECSVSKDRIIDIICDMINQKSIPSPAINTAILAIGWICDQRYQNDISPNTLGIAKSTIQDMGRLYPMETISLYKIREMVLKVLSGVQLTAAEEKLLLEQLNK